MSDRTPYDGKPYYCNLCGLGWGEVLACEEPDCKLETEAEAVKRQQARATADKTRATTKKQRAIP